MSAKTKSVLKRFAKGFISGAITAMALVKITTPASWTDLKTLAIILAFAGIGGGINGLILAIQKWASWKKE